MATPIFDHPLPKLFEKYLIYVNFHHHTEKSGYFTAITGDMIESCNLIG